MFPQELCTAFTETSGYDILENKFHDATLIRGQLAATPRRTWRLAQKLNASLLATLKSFYDAHNGGQIPFTYYDPFAVVPGAAPGSNYDPTGVSVVGAVWCVFRGNWSETTGLARTDGPQLELVEVQ